VARMFPQGFRWGVASSGHQTEGDNTRSDTWFLEHVRPTVFREASAKACNSYELWREDVDLVAGLGLDTYRFSVEWARVEPAEGEFSAAALAHYRAIIDHCLASRIAPVVTRYAARGEPGGGRAPVPGRQRRAPRGDGRHG
jgi:beta-glucosidase